MYHSVIISGHNTWDDWHMVPYPRPSIAPAEVKTEYVEIPGAHGKLDYTEALTGEVVYGNRTGSWEFIVDNGHQEWYALYSFLQTYLHGKVHTISLEDEPDYQYTGRLKVNEWKSEEVRSKITIDYDLSPFKTLTDGNVSDWKWDDLSTDANTYIIYYGTFDVYDKRERNFYNPSEKTVELSLTLTTAMSAFFYGTTYEFKSGVTKNTGIMLIPGDNYITFYGTGRVKASYDRSVVS